MDRRCILEAHTTQQGRSPGEILTQVTVQGGTLGWVRRALLGECRCVFFSGCRIKEGEESFSLKENKGHVGGPPPPSLQGRTSRDIDIDPTASICTTYLETLKNTVVPFGADSRVTLFQTSELKGCHLYKERRLKTDPMVKRTSNLPTHQSI